MSIEHTYENTGKYQIKAKNFLTVPELDHLYTIKSEGLNTSADMFILKDDITDQIICLKPEDIDDFITPEEEIDLPEARLVDDDVDLEITFGDAITQSYSEINPYTIRIPSGKTVDPNILKLKSNIQYVKFPMQIESMDIQTSAFCGMTNLISVYIPPYVKSIGKDAFKNCHNLTSIYCPISLSNDIKQSLTNETLEHILVNYYGNKESKAPSSNLFSSKKSVIQSQKLVSNNQIKFKACPIDASRPGEDQIIQTNEEWVDSGECEYNRKIQDQNTKNYERNTDVYNVKYDFEKYKWEINLTLSYNSGGLDHLTRKAIAGQSIKNTYNSNIESRINYEINELNNKVFRQYTYSTVKVDSAIYSFSNTFDSNTYIQKFNNILSTVNFGKKISIPIDLGDITVYIPEDGNSLTYHINEAVLEIQLRAKSIKLEKVSSQKFYDLYGQFSYMSFKHMHEDKYVDEILISYKPIYNTHQGYIDSPCGDYESPQYEEPHQYIAGWIETSEEGDKAVLVDTREKSSSKTEKIIYKHGSNSTEAKTIYTVQIINSSQSITTIDQLNNPLSKNLDILGEPGYEYIAALRTKEEINIKIRDIKKSMELTTQCDLKPS